MKVFCAFDVFSLIVKLVLIWQKLLPSTLFSDATEFNRHTILIYEKQTPAVNGGAAD